jgi:molybdopterin converting factor small subunit
MVELYSFGRFCKNISVSGDGKIKIKVLFFGATADAAGARFIDLETPPGTPAGSMLDRLLGLYPRMSEHKLLYSDNEEYAQGTERLNDGDEMAVFTAVSGG